MSIPLDISKKRSLHNLLKNQTIQFQSDFVDLAYYIVFEIDKDLTIPALLVSLWKFEGGYDHAVINFLENDLGLNKQVVYVEPNVDEGRITKIINYRPRKSNLSKKEEFFYDVRPTNTQITKSIEYPIPFEVEVDNGEKTVFTNIPSWTPMQRIPVEQISLGSIVEIWKIENINTIMKVKSL